MGKKGRVVIPSLTQKKNETKSKAQMLGNTDSRLVGKGDLGDQKKKTG